VAIQRSVKDFPLFQEKVTTIGIESLNDDPCEVLTFGRAHHCALGVGTTDTSNSSSASSASENKTTSLSFRPQRVQAFCQSQVGKSHSAVAVAAAAHHTMVLNRMGQVYCFGLNKGGRLGIGSEQHSPLPTLVTTLNNQGRRIVFIAAAENHSLAVTSCGQVYAWGSNRFGQLGIASSFNNNSGNNTSGSTNNNDVSGGCALFPRRVDDLKDVGGHVDRRSHKWKILK
jgi:alpha-tubulin suppressor-like RCC1 family protein